MLAAYEMRTSQSQYMRFCLGKASQNSGLEGGGKRQVN
jgi:hypothetical protein